jgi:hypothetical protein
MDQVLFMTRLNPTPLRAMFSAIDAVDQGRKPDEQAIESAAVELDRFAPKNGAHWHTQDPCVAVVREAITAVAVPWFKVPRRSEITNGCMQDFLRSLRKKCRSVRKLEPKEREALRLVLLFLVERLPKA